MKFLPNKTYKYSGHFEEIIFRVIDSNSNAADVRIIESTSPMFKKGMRIQLIKNFPIYSTSISWPPDNKRHPLTNIFK